MQGKPFYLGSEKAMNSTAPTSRPSAAEIERMIREGVPPGKYLVRVMWDGNMQNTSAQGSVSEIMLIERRAEKSSKVMCVTNR